MENNKGYVAASGPVYDTTMCQTKPKHNQIWGILSQPISQYPAFDRKEELAESRIYNYLAGRKNSYIWSALHRADIILKVCQIIEKANPCDLRFNSHFFSLDPMFWKSKRGDAMHDLSPKIILVNLKVKISQKGTWYNWIQGKEWFTFYKKMISVLVENITVSEYTTEDLKRRIEVYYQAQIGQMNIREFHPSYKAELFFKVKQSRNMEIFMINSKRLEIL